MTSCIVAYVEISEFVSTLNQILLGYFDSFNITFCKKINTFGDDLTNEPARKKSLVDMVVW